MALITQSIPNMINGVSQQPPTLRLKTQAEEQVNAISDVVTGLSKRPCSEVVAKLPTISNIDDAFIHTIRRDENEFYTLVVTSGQLNVFDKDGATVTVTGDASYLSGLTSPSKELTATTVADYTFLVNKNTVVAEDDTNQSESERNEGLIYIKQADYSCTYKVTVKDENDVELGYAEYQAPTSEHVEHEFYVSTSFMMKRIMKGLMGNYGVFNNNRADLEDEPVTDQTTNHKENTPSTGIHTWEYEHNSNDVLYRVVYKPLSTASGRTWTNTGVVNESSVGYITSNQPFKIEVSDSRGNTHMFAFKGQTTDFKKLPTEATPNFKIKVIGDSSKAQDDYYVSYVDPEGEGQYVWKESIAPSTTLSFDQETMPHQLVKQTDGSFVFQPVEWIERKVGDTDSNPFPSFTGYAISDIFFYRNRLGILADENVIFSEAGNFENFFLTTVLTLVDSAPIDVAVSNNKVSILKHAVPFNESLLLFSDLTQFRLTASDILTPETVQIDATTQFEASLASKPVGAGKYVFFATRRGEFAGIRELFVDQDSETTDAADVTGHVPKYLKGVATQLKASTNEDMLVALSSDSRKDIYVYKYYWRGNEKLQSSWSTWTFDGDVLSVDFNLSEIYMVVKHSDGTYIERVNLSEDTAKAETTAGIPMHLDRRELLTSSQSTPVVSDSNLKYVTTAGKEIGSSAVSQALSDGFKVYSGVPYTFKYTFSEQVIKDNDEALLRGRLQLRNMDVVFNDTSFFNVEITPKQRDTNVKTFTGRLIGSIANILGQVPVESGRYRFPILSKADQVTISLTSDSFLPCTFMSAEWEGLFHVRARRV